VTGQKCRFEPAWNTIPAVQEKNFHTDEVLDNEWMGYRKMPGPPGLLAPGPTG
jgi:hypothetical protein